MSERRGRFPEWLPLVAGTTLSIGLGALFYFRTDLKTAVAAFAGLLGVAIALQLELLLQSRHMVATQRRRELIAARIEEIDWLPQIVDDNLKALQAIRDGRPVPLVTTLAKMELESCAERLRDLQRGFLTDRQSQEVDIMDMLTLGAKVQLRATSGPAELTWWLGPEASFYLRRQTEAVRRGVAVERIFIYEDWSDVLDEICRRQRNLGIKVLRVEAKRLKGIRNPDLIIWDDSCAFSVEYNAVGAWVNSRFTFVSTEIRKLDSTFEIVKSAAEELPPPNSP